MNNAKQIFGIAVGSSFVLTAEIYNLRMAADRPCGEAQFWAERWSFDPASGTLRTTDAKATGGKEIRAFCPIEGRSDIFIGRLLADGVEMFRDPRAR